MKKFLFVFFILFITKTPAFASDLGYLEIEVNKEAGIIRTMLEFNPASLGLKALQFHNTLGKSFWKMGTTRCPWRNISSKTLSYNLVKVSADAACPEIKSEITLDLSFLQQASAGYRIIGRIRNDGQESTFLAGKSERNVKISPVPDRSFGHYVYSGAKQIGATLSILFIITLVVTAGSLMEIFKTVVGFSLGTSLSLLLALFGVISIPARFIEPAIAMSIVFLAAEGILRKKTLHRFWLASGFGLIHGFGFATGLSSLPLSLFELMKAFIGFNMGLEIGQLLIIIMIVPFIIFIKKYSNYHHQFMRGTSALLFVVGCYWIVERAIL
ncbi:MAG: HupE/UreJ family protein [Bacteriovorax sp.]|jgi:hypothetical protein